MRAQHYSTKQKHCMLLIETWMIAIHLNRIQCMASIYQRKVRDLTEVSYYLESHHSTFLTPSQHIHHGSTDNSLVKNNELSLSWLIRILVTCIELYLGGSESTLPSTLQISCAVDGQVQQYQSRRYKTVAGSKTILILVLTVKECSDTPVAILADASPAMSSSCIGDTIQENPTHQGHARFL
jgi:hypothetical protein